MRRGLTSLVVVAACFAAAGYSSAQSILWDQQPDFTLTTTIDLDIPSPGDSFSTYQVNDATFESAVNITAITTFYTNNTGTWENLINTGVLNIFDGDGLVASDDPTSGGDFGPGSVSVTSTDLGSNVIAVTAFVDINLAAGTYWFGLTPSLPSASDPQEFRYDDGQIVGAASQARNPAGGFGLGTAWFNGDTLAPGFSDATFTILGEEIPEPTTAGLLALGLVGLVARRRRRRRR